MSEQYLENIPELLSSIEKINPLLKNQKNNSEDLQKLINNLFSKLNHIKNLTIYAKKDMESLQELILKYKNSSMLFPILKRFLISEKLNSARGKISLLIVKVFQTNNEILKFLRHNWYEYEVSIDE
jgi:hypothetical protein